MKASIIILILWCGLMPQAFRMGDELTLLSSRIELDLQAKGWQLVYQFVRDDVGYHYWQSKGHYVKLSFFYCDTEEETAKKLQQDLAALKAEFGPASKVQDLGDEAYAWGRLKRGQSLVNFRKGRVIVAVVGQSNDEVNDCAKRVVDLIERRAAKTAV